MEKNEILAVAIDAIKGKSDGKFSASQTSDELRNAFIELNGGSTKISPKTFYRGSELFDLVEELIPVVIEEGIKADDNPLFQNIVEYRNLKDGDSAQFDVQGEANFVVATVAPGDQGIRRQRIAAGNSITLKPEVKAIRVYEELGRLLAGRIDFNQYVEGVANAFKAYVANAAFAAINGMSAATAGLSSTYVLTGTPTEAQIVAMIEHVEAATGKKATIYGTKGALRKLAPTVSGELYKDDMYKLGYYGMYNGTPCVRMNQAHVPGTETFALSEDKIWVLAGDSKPVKVVRAGEGLLIEKDATQNADLTQEYFYAEALACGVIVSEKIGISAV